MSLPNKPTLPNWFAKMEMLANALFPSCCPVLEVLCTHLDDAALVNLTKSTSRRVVASAMREIVRRPVFALLQDISGKGRWKASTEFCKVCETGSLWGVQKMIQRGADDWNSVLWYACKGGHRALAELMIQHGATDWNVGLHCACFKGHRDLADLMIQKGASDWNLGLSGACVGGHLELAELMVQNGANNWNRGLRGACVGGHRELAEIMIQKGATHCTFYDCPGHEFVVE
jgi:hypothetical protein